MLDVLPLVLRIPTMNMSCSSGKQVIYHFQVYFPQTNFNLPHQNIKRPQMKFDLKNVKLNFPLMKLDGHIMKLKFPKVKPIFHQ